MAELTQQIEIHSQRFIKSASFNYVDIVLECETKAATQNIAAQGGSLIHDVQCRAQLPETLIFDEEERVIHFIAELFAGYAYIEIIERVDGEDHLSVMTTGKGNVETNPFFEQEELEITLTVGNTAPITMLKVSRSSGPLNAFFDQLPASSRSTPGERRDSTIMLIESELQDALDAQGHPDVKFQIEDRSHQANHPTIDFKCLAPIKPASFDQQMFKSTILQSGLGLLKSP
ncbi:hypothetical protein [Rhodoferax aquaticus]|uniref:Uncharacterized protein n=1 Tax=Rhodoferax aquaticus TaxID=2527691 RepID=A0A515EQQ7_9BURK|nr:hypothetical protein [Rhodoferax aquaticus]QDL54997.1 hypothetical protein EXZ61_12945 [Rhodoferax aquaticus]